MKIPFPNPQNKVYLQNNRTDVYPLGNIWSSNNLDFQSNQGAMRISPRLMIASDSTGDADLGTPVAFRWFDSALFAICDTRIFQSSGAAPSNTFVEDAATGAQTDYEADASDMEIFNSTLCASTRDGLFSKASNGSGTGAWTQRDILQNGSNHVMTYFKKFDRLYYANATDNILSIDPAWVTADPGFDYAINLSPNTSTDYQITSLRSSSSFIWAGTLNNYSMGRQGKLVQWDGISAAITNEFIANNAQGIMAIAIHPEQDNPYVMDSNGIISAYNGTGLSEVGRLPLPFSKLPYNIGDSDNESFIHPNGMYFTKNGTLRFAINNRSAISTEAVIENMPSGVWEWSKDNGTVHVESFTYMNGVSPSVTDWGQNRIARIGALVSMNIPTNTASSDGTECIGANIYTDASSNISAIFFNNSKNTQQKKGYFVTDWFESDEIADKWDRWWVSHRKFLDATDKIVFKYRISQETPVEGTITWVNTTSFTVSNSVCDVSQFWTSGTGGEVEILRGVGGGLCAHITNAVLAGGTWTVTIDEVATGATTTTATARFQKWVKLEPAQAADLIEAWNQWGIGTDSTPRIQLKGCFTLTGNGEFYKGVLHSTDDIKVTA